MMPPVRSRHPVDADLDLEALRPIGEEIRRHLVDRINATNEEIRDYPTPIARCDEQLTQLIEQRTGIFRELRRLDAAADKSLVGSDYAALIEECIGSPAFANEEAAQAIRTRLAAALSRMRR